MSQRTAEVGGEKRVGEWIDAQVDWLQTLLFRYRYLMYIPAQVLYLAVVLRILVRLYQEHSGPVSSGSETLSDIFCTVYKFLLQCCQIKHGTSSILVLKWKTF